MSLSKIILAIFGIFISLSSVAQNNIGTGDLPVKAFPSSKQQEILFIYFTGDGGWNNFSQELVAKIGSKGYPVVAFDTRKYFWSAKTPAIFASDVEIVIQHYLAYWNLHKVAIVGYSFGADVAAFLPARLKSTATGQLMPMALLSPSHSSDFEVKLADLLGSKTNEERKYNVEEALGKCSLPVLCIFGEDEDLYLKESLLESGKVKIKEIPGSHRYGNNVGLITDLILAEINAVH